MSKTITVYHNDENLINDICRVDFSGQEIGKIKRTDEGYLTGEAPVARIGIYQYVLTDGSIRAELVNRDTLFNSDSMNSLKMKPITDTHPPERSLNSKNVKRRKVGFTGENIKRDGDFLVTPLTITDADAIENIDQGRKELSPGYICDLLLEPGTFNYPGHSQHGKRYDGIQLNRKYNHLATCDKARGGAELKLNLDQVEHYDGFEVIDTILVPEKVKVVESIKNIFDSEYLTDSEIQHIINKRKGQNMPQLQVKGINYDAAQEVINFCGEETKRADAAIKRADIAEVQVKAIQSKLDKAEGERDGLKTKVDTLEKVDHADAINKGVNERIEILKVANVVLDDESKKKLATMKNDEIKLAIIKAKSPDINLDSVSNDYISGVYNTVVSDVKFDSDAIGRQRGDSAFIHDNNGDPDDKARKDSEDKMQNNYKDFGGKHKE